jgi:hypothetical protein
MNNRHFLESIFLLDFLKKITEKDKLKSVDYLCLPTYYTKNKNYRKERKGIV